jgi:hypothetical protein
MCLLQPFRDNMEKHHHHSCMNSQDVFLLYVCVWTVYSSIISFSNTDSKTSMCYLYFGWHLGDQRQKLATAYMLHVVLCKLDRLDERKEEERIICHSHNTPWTSQLPGRCGILRRLSVACPCIVESIYKQKPWTGVGILPRKWIHRCSVFSPCLCWFLLLGRFRVSTASSPVSISQCVAFRSCWVCVMSSLFTYVELQRSSCACLLTTVMAPISVWRHRILFRFSLAKPGRYAFSFLTFATLWWQLCACFILISRFHKQAEWYPVRNHGPESLLYRNTHARARARTHTHTHIHIYTHTHTHVCVSWHFCKTSKKLHIDLVRLKNVLSAWNQVLIVTYVSDKSLPLEVLVHISITFFIQNKTVYNH